MLICELKYSLADAAKTLDISESALRRWFKMQDLPIPPSNRRIKRKYEISNESIFNSINTDEKAYWLGFLWADGYIIKAKNKEPEGVRIELNINDAGHVKKFLSFLGSQHPIKTVKPQLHKHGPVYTHARVDIYSRALTSGLLKLGLCAHRSTTSVEVPTIQDQFLRHFLRGLFDGDGSIHRDSRVGFPLSGWMINIAGSSKVVNLWNLHVCEKICSRRYAEHQNGSNRINRKIEISGPNAILVIKWLYSGNNITALDSHSIIVDLLVSTSNKWALLGLGVDKQGRGIRYVNTKAISDQEKRSFVKEICNIEPRAVKYWGFMGSTRPNAAY